MKTERALLFDVGGTWTRYAYSDGKKLISPKSISTSEFALDNIKKLVSESEKKISSVIIACAGQVVNGKCKMTNANLLFDERTLSTILGVQVKVINDFFAAACALKKNKGTLIIGPGTGLGVSIITKKGEIKSSEEGHLKIKRELFLSIPEFNHVNIPEYEQVLAGKNNILLKLLNKEKIELGKNRLTEIYSATFESFLQELLNLHKEDGIKKIIIRGGIVVNNKKFFAQYIKTLKKKSKKETSKSKIWPIFNKIEDIKVIEDDYLGLKGAMEIIEK